MSPRSVLFLTLLAMTTTTGCVGQCLDEDGIVPGVGVSEAGASLCLDEPWPTVDKRLGAPATTSDLQGAGVRLTWSEPALVGYVTSQDEVGTVSGLQLSAGVTALTAGGVGLGSDDAAVRAEFGDPLLDPLLGGWLYLSDGIGFQWDGGAVSAIHLFVP
jgi:hypothetical protein